MRVYHSLQFSGELRGLDGLQRSISLAAEIIHKLPEAIHILLPADWRGFSLPHSTGIAA